jgi:hypothetical protein
MATNIPEVVFDAAFHLEGNFLPEGNLGLWKKIGKEIGRKYCYKEGNDKKFYFIS